MNGFLQLRLLMALCLCVLAPITFGSTNAVANRRDPWSLQPLSRPPLPPVQNKRWPHSPIDYFILARLEQSKLRPSSEADRATLIRRLSFDLTGLPPTPRELDAFLHSKSPMAYDEVV